MVQFIVWSCGSIACDMISHTLVVGESMVIFLKPDLDGQKQLNVSGKSDVDDILCQLRRASFAAALPVAVEAFRLLAKELPPSRS